MRTSKFTPEQMVHILRQGDGGVPVAELCRQHGISEQTYYLYGRSGSATSARRRSASCASSARRIGSSSRSLPT
jgi:transposase-like protein